MTTSLENPIQSSTSSIAQPAASSSQARDNWNHPISASPIPYRRPVYSAARFPQRSRPAPLRMADSSLDLQRTNSRRQVIDDGISAAFLSPFFNPTPIVSVDASRRSPSPGFFSAGLPKGSRSTAASSSRDYLPAESNDYLGLCRSAWRMQVGQDVSAIKIRQRATGGLYPSVRYYACSRFRCHFEGRVVRDSSGHDSIDRTVTRFSDQVHFRWKFLMRCHVQARSNVTVSFGCVLCSSPLVADSSEILPIFDGERAFLQHIQEAHVGEGQWPEGHARYRAGCVVSKGYPDDDNWDLLLLDWDGISSPHGAPQDLQHSELERLDGADLHDPGESGLVHELDDVGRLDLGPDTSS